MKDKVDAIYELREAAELHGRASVRLEEQPQSPQANDALLEARAKLEAATVDAIESCHFCGEAHASIDHR